MKSRLLLLFFLAVFVISAPRSVLATDADILGVVQDETGAFLPGVSITAKHIDTGLVRTTATDGQGRYRIVSLPAGRYAVTAELDGFQTVVRDGITLTINMKANLNFLMKVAAVQETITVTGESPIVETTTSEVGLTFTRETVDNLPSNGRNPNDLLLLAPGVSVGRTRGGYSVAGGLERNNSYTIDGIDNNDDIVGGSRVDLQRDVVREFQLISNQFSAEFGRGVGGSVNVLTQSGTNDFKARVNFFLREDAIDAQPYLSKKAGVEKSPFSRKTYGGNLGGPIVKDKTHFFVAYEEERETENIEWDLPKINYPAVGSYPAIQGGFRVQPRPTKNPKVFGKLTHQFNTAHSLAVTFNYDHQAEPFTDCSGTDLGCYDFTADDYFFLASETWVISPRTLNEVRLARTKYDYLFLVTEGQNYPFHDRPGIDYGQQTNMPQGRDERHWIVSDTFSRIFNWQGDHELRFGAEVNIEGSASFFDSNFGGTFLFDTDSPFDPNNRSTYPYRFTQRTGDSTLDRDMNLYSAFIQDNWRIKPNFTLNLGVRYDVEKMAPHLLNTNQQGKFNIPALAGDTNYRTDTNNLAPRIGFAWDPRNDGKTVIRGGFGLFFDQLFLNIQGNVYRFGVVPRTVDLTIERPCYPDPSVVIPGVCGGTATPGVSRSPTVSTGQEVQPRGRNLSVGFTREIAADLSVSADFVHLRTYHWPRGLDLNRRCTLTGTLEGDCSGPVGSDLSRLDRRWLSVTHAAADGNKWYKGLQVGLRKRLSNDHQFQLSYTLSKTEDDASDFGARAQSDFHPERDKGLSPEDQRHRLVFAGSWTLPWGIHLGGILTYNNGRPFNISMGTDWNGNGSSVDRPNSIPTRENVDQGTPDTRPYNPQGPRLFGADGTLPRFAGQAPNFFSIDLRVSKFIRFGNRSVEVLAEFFNLTNRVNQDPDFVSGNVRSTQYYLRRLMRGEIAATDTFDPFQAQIGFRFNF